MTGHISVALMMAALLSACATSPQPAVDDVASKMLERTGRRVEWNNGSDADAKVEARVSAMLGKGLTMGEAVDIALLNNRHLQAHFEDLGVAQADLVDAGLLENPSIGLGLMFPFAGGLADLHGSVAWSLVDAFMIPARKKLARAELEAAKAELGQEIVDLVAETQSAYISLQAAQQSFAVQRSTVEAAEVASTLAERQHEAGGLNALDLGQVRAFYQSAKLELTHVAGEVRDQRERLNRLLGLWGPQLEWKIEDRLPPLPEQEPELVHLESLAVKQRPDLSAARFEVAVLQRVVKLARANRFVGIDVGAGIERDDGELKAGPELDIELPIFNAGQADVARAQSMLRQSRWRLDGLAIDIRSEVRQAMNHLVFSRRMTEYSRDVRIPQREEIVRLAQVRYNAMLTGVYELIAFKQEEYESRLEYLQLLKDYWLARAELERVIGGGRGIDADLNADLNKGEAKQGAQ